MTLPFDPAAFPERPPSEVEWEELLVKLELAPRAFRIAVDEAGRSLQVVRVLLDAAMWEASLRAILDAMKEGDSPAAAASAEWEPGAEAPADYFLREFAALRARNFAAVQRRGVEVWEWAAEGGVVGRKRVSAYQVLSATAAMDGLRLRAVRAAGNGRGHRA